MIGAQVQTASRERWLHIVKTSHYATYFHTPYWYELTAPGKNHTAIEVSFDDGASAIIPIAKVMRMKGLMTDYFSSPYGNYGGWISASILNEDHIKVLTDILTSKKNLTFRINPFDDSQTSLSTITASSPHVKLINDYTHIVDLTKGDAKLHSELSGGHRNAINIAKRNGVIIKAAETFDEWERYYNVYTDSLGRWKSWELKTRTVYPLTLFKRLYENRTGNETLWLALKDEEVIAGTLLFYWGRHAVAWHGAALAGCFDLRPNNLLYWEIFKNAQSRGYEVFDFNPSGGYSRVESFKKHFGAVQMPAPLLQTKTPLRSLISNLHARRMR
ncbi:MAG: GNAT family N-acetyltransferase [Chitinispirillia bacterium]|nr:GNAT family N-acetyltransferase [Chitinispirillia bacterium]